MNEGLITIQSQFSVKETIDRLVAKVTSVGLLVFARVDHAAGAKQAGFDLHLTKPVDPLELQRLLASLPVGSS